MKREDAIEIYEDGAKTFRESARTGREESRPDYAKACDRTATHYADQAAKLRRDGAR